MRKFELRPCRKCGTMAAVPVRRANHALHAVLSLLTVGVWLPVWLFAIFEASASRRGERGFATERECPACNPQETAGETFASAFRMGYQRGRRPA